MVLHEGLSRRPVDPKAAPRLDGYLLRRVGQALVVLLGVTVLVFWLEHIIPGSLARAILGPRASPRLAALTGSTGSTAHSCRGIPHFLSDVLHGNLGYSYRLNLSVDSLVVHELPNDLILVGSRWGSSCDRDPARGRQAARRNRAFDHSRRAWRSSTRCRRTGSDCCSSPGLPSERTCSLRGATASPRGGPRRPPWARAAGGDSHPRQRAPCSAGTCASAVDTLAQDYVRVARSERDFPVAGLFACDVMRNSLVPIVTILGLSIPASSPPGARVEYVFNFPGLGLTDYNVAVNADYPVELGITVDRRDRHRSRQPVGRLAYAALDPRISYC